ncbi:hypothetical protein H312_02631 [Anncaliia algerae PRA339]|uniref:Uncharacterized protein n=1 Tax=Anncaliia algerae PRA339 TaxID=1288291 RepID=A0A059EY61_9MICR|nr:hypothetical protein H312_02622 [Anncaliia algerae PRA339]KCZ79982.1 hypothetical protein H312_02631 [Anncaliia algerae PRA339]
MEKLLCKQTKQEVTNCSNSLIHSDCFSKKSFDVFSCYNEEKVLKNQPELYNNLTSYSKLVDSKCFYDKIYERNKCGKSKIKKIYRVDVIYSKNYYILTDIDNHEEDNKDKIVADIHCCASS